MRHHPNDSAPTTRVPLRAKFAAIFTLLTFYLLLASNAFAAGGGAADPEAVGRRLAHTFSTFGGYVLFTLAGFALLAMASSRQHKGVLGLLSMVFLAGAMFFAPGQIKDIIKGILDAATGG